MNSARLKSLGLGVEEVEGTTTVEVTFVPPLINPLTRDRHESAQLTPAGVRLAVLWPQELVGVPPIPLAGLTSASELEQHLRDAFDEGVSRMARLTSELQQLGLTPTLEPRSLRLTVTVEVATWRFLLGADRRGLVRVVSASQEGEALKVDPGHTFSLGELRERSALEGYLVALFGGELEQSAPSTEAKPAAPTGLTFSEIARLFGAHAQLPARSGLEMLVELEVQGARYRFAAARVSGRIFRGLLAGSSGKVWADRFDLDDFLGIEDLVGRLLGVDEGQVQFVEPELVAQPDAADEGPTEASGAGSS